MLFGEVGPGQIVLVDVDGDGPDAAFTFHGQKVGGVPDLPPLETVDAEGVPIEGPDDTEGPVDVPRTD